MRCKGRIENSSLNQEAKTPMLLSSKDHSVDLIVGDNHQRMLYGGVNTTLTSARERFWILQGRRAVKKVPKKTRDVPKGAGTAIPTITDTRFTRRASF